MYGYNSKSVDQHEGEYEHLVVKLDAIDRAPQVAYFEHNCAPHIYLWQTMQDKSLLAEGTHPIVYSSKGGHASYPLIPQAGQAYSSDLGSPYPMIADDTDKTFLYPCKGDPKGQLLGLDVKTHDEVSSSGVRWQTWLNLGDATRQPWYGYVGAWGHVGKLALTTGPLGPPHARPAPKGW
jgi:hypothetical protein